MFGDDVVVVVLGGDVEDDLVGLGGVDDSFDLGRVDVSAVDW